MRAFKRWHKSIRRRLVNLVDLLARIVGNESEATAFILIIYRVNHTFKRDRDFSDLDRYFCEDVRDSDRSLHLINNTVVRPELVGQDKTFGLVRNLHRRRPRQLN